MQLVAKKQGSWKNKKALHHVTEHFIVLEPQNPRIREFSVVQKRESTGFEIIKMGNAWSGISCSLEFVLN